MIDRHSREQNAVIILLVARGLRGFADGFAAIILPVYLSVLGYSTAEIGIIATLSLLGTALISLVVGFIAPRFELRSLMIAGAWLLILTGLLFPAFDAFVFIAAIAFAGTINPSTGDLGWLVPLEHSLLTQETADRERTRAFARYSLIGSLATAAGSLGAVIPDFLGSLGIGKIAALKSMFLAYAAFGAAAAFLYRALPRDHAQARAPTLALGPSRAIVYKLSALFSIDSFAGGFVVQSLLALWLFERFDLSLAAAGVFFFWTNLLSAFSYPVAAWISRHIGLVNTMVFTHIPSSLCLIAAAFVPNAYLALALLLVRAALSQMDVPTRSSYVMAVVTPSERTAAASVTAVPRSLASAISPAFAGAMLGGPWSGLPLIICGALKIGYDLTLLAMFRHVRPPEETR